MKKIEQIQLHREGDNEYLQVVLVLADGREEPISWVSIHDQGWQAVEEVEAMAIDLASVLGVKVVES